MLTAFSPVILKYNFHPNVKLNISNKKERPRFKEPLFQLNSVNLLKNYSKCFTNVSLLYYEHVNSGFEITDIKRLLG